MVIGTETHKLSSQNNIIYTNYVILQNNEIREQLYLCSFKLRIVNVFLN